MLTNIEKQIITLIQDDIPVTQRPYLEMAQALNISEDECIKTLQNFHAKGVLRRFGATLRHQKSGFKSNAMTAWNVAPKKVVETGEIMASFNEVSHCYHRNPAEDWPYNLYTMIHAMNEEDCKEIARKISIATSVDDYCILFSKKELKKTSMQYFK